MQTELNITLREYIYSQFDGDDGLTHTRFSLYDVRIYWEMACECVREQNRYIREGYPANIVRYFEAKGLGIIGVRAESRLTRKQWMVMLICFNRCYLTVEEVDAKLSGKIIYTLVERIPNHT